MTLADRRSALRRHDSYRALALLLEQLGHPKQFSVRPGEPTSLRWTVREVRIIVSVVHLRSWVSCGWLFVDEASTAGVRVYRVADLFDGEEDEHSE